MLEEDRNSGKQLPRLGKIGEEVLNGVSEILSMQQSTTLPPFYLAVRQQMYERTKTALGRNHAKCIKREVRVFDIFIIQGCCTILFMCIFPPVSSQSYLPA